MDAIKENEGQKKTRGDVFSDAHDIAISLSGTLNVLILYLTNSVRNFQD